MTAGEFFEEVKKSLKSTESNDPVGAEFFISDMEDLFDKWEDEKEPTVTEERRP